MPAEFPSAAIADAGPLIHLDELDALSVLRGFSEILVPVVVALEADRHRPTWRSGAPSGLRIEDPPVVRVRAFLRSVSLDMGEAAALALWQEHPTTILLCDDLAARRYAESIGCPVTGTLGLLLWAGRVGRIELERARALVRSMPERTTLHIRPGLIDTALRSLDDV